MHWGAIGYLAGLLLMVFSTAMLPPLAIAWYYGDGALVAFVDSYLLTLGTGFVLWVTLRGAPRDLNHRDGFLLVTLFWVVLALFGALPLLLSGATPGFTSAFFESMSGLTTTGSTVLSGIEDLPHGIRFWRQEMQWLGGMGIIILALAILPILQVGGMQLYKAEVPGPVKDQKLTPRVNETAKALWLIYIGLTVVAVLALWAAGMGPFDAVAHAFSSVATGGFSPYDDSVGHFSSPLIHYLIVLFMFLGGANFALHFAFLHGGGLRGYLGDPEFRAYLALHVVAALLVTGFLMAYQAYPSLEESFRSALFQTVSIGTTTGFATADYAAWPSLLPFFILMIGFFMGSAGSTTGGIKVMRFLLLWKQGIRQAYLLIHPHAIAPIKMRERAVPEGVIQAVWGFFAVYVTTFILLTLVMMALEGGKFETSVGAVGATLTCVGPGLGEVGPANNFASISTPGQWVLSLAMLMGRLELFTFFVLLMPAFWRK
ncbi:TrkH family potassium uptake protein [Thiohalorhabdus denitrificans]|uniref:Trk system potassium uptake protein n=1 Tax=Thiohalorhabdus denitrificans TaxID=381306 RepID=A0A1G5ECR0_9GAMM|nr:potassium transporter TrkG [Thiohalorhabdus denitrificans]SCY24541.1 trk system potassium uptake protein TrkH [Thiohalorhabdus denitrificans]